MDSRAPKRHQLDKDSVEESDKDSVDEIIAEIFNGVDGNDDNSETFGDNSMLEDHFNVSEDAVGRMESSSASARDSLPVSLTNTTVSRNSTQRTLPESEAPSRNNISKLLLNEWPIERVKETIDNINKVAASERERVGVKNNIRCLSIRRNGTYDCLYKIGGNPVKYKYVSSKSMPSIEFERNPSVIVEYKRILTGEKDKEKEKPFHYCASNRTAVYYARGLYIVCKSCASDKTDPASNYPIMSVRACLRSFNSYKTVDVFESNWHVSSIYKRSAILDAIKETISKALSSVGVVGETSKASFFKSLWKSVGSFGVTRFGFHLNLEKEMKELESDSTNPGEHKKDIDTELERYFQDLDMRRNLIHVGKIEKQQKTELKSKTDSSSATLLDSIEPEPVIEPFHVDEDLDASDDIDVDAFEAVLSSSEDEFEESTPSMIEHAESSSAVAAAAEDTHVGKSSVMNLIDKINKKVHSIRSSVTSRTARMIKKESTNDETENAKLTSMKEKIGRLNNSKALLKSLKKQIVELENKMDEYRKNLVDIDKQLASVDTNRKLLKAEKSNISMDASIEHIINDELEAFEIDKNRIKQRERYNIKVLKVTEAKLAEKMQEIARIREEIENQIQDKLA